MYDVELLVQFLKTLITTFPSWVKGIWCEQIGCDISTAKKDSKAGRTGRPGRLSTYQRHWEWKDPHGGLESTVATDDGKKSVPQSDHIIHHHGGHHQARKYDNTTQQVPFKVYTKMVEAEARIQCQLYTIDKLKTDLQQTE